MIVLARLKIIAISFNASIKNGASVGRRQKRRKIRLLGGAKTHAPVSCFDPLSIPPTFVPRPLHNPFSLVP